MNEKNDFGRIIFGNRWAMTSLTLVAIHQSIVAISAIFLTNAITNFQEQKSFKLSLALYFAAMVTPYIPGCLSLIHLQKWINQSHDLFVNFSSEKIQRRTNLYAKTISKQKTSTILSRNSFTTIREYIEFLHGATSLILNSVLSTSILAYLLPSQIFLGYLASSMICMTIIIISRKKIHAASTATEQQQILYSVTLQRAWSNLCLGNTANIDMWKEQKEGRGSNFYSTSARLQSVKQKTNLLLAAASLIPTVLLLCAILRAEETPPPLLAAIIVNLTRIFLILNSLSTVVSQLTEFSSIHAKMAILLNAVPQEPETGASVHTYLRSIHLDNAPIKDAAEIIHIIKNRTSGRFLVTGRNGSGKSTILLELKSQLGNAAILVPAHPDDLIWSHEEITGSTGEMKIANLTSAISSPHCKYLLLDEWDANLDYANIQHFDETIGDLSRHKIIVEVRHRQTKS